MINEKFLSEKDIRENSRLLLDFQRIFNKEDEPLAPREMPGFSYSLSSKSFLSMSSPHQKSTQRSMVSITSGTFKNVKKSQPVHGLNLNFQKLINSE